MAGHGTRRLLPKGDENGMGMSRGSGCEEDNQHGQVSFVRKEGCLRGAVLDYVVPESASYAHPEEIKRISRMRYWKQITTNFELCSSEVWWKLIGMGSHSSSLVGNAVVGLLHGGDVAMRVCSPVCDDG